MARAAVGHRLIVGLLLALALMIRVGHLVELGDDPFIDRPIMDAEYHDLWAHAIEEGRPLVSEVFFRAPLYPYFLSAIYRLAGDGRWPARLVQLGLGLLSMLLIYRIARRLLGPGPALLALLLAVLHDLFPYFEGELLLPCLLIVLNLLAFDRMLAARSGRSRRDAALSGALWGLSAIARPNILAVVPFLAAWLGAERRRRALALIVVAAALPLPLLVSGVNWIRGGDPVFIASQGGVNFYLGNNPASNGWSAVAPGMRADWWGSYEDGIKIPEAQLGRALRPSEVSAYWARRALGEIAADPIWWLRHLARKSYLWFGAEELSNNRDLAFWKKRFALIDALPVRYAALVPLALLGLLSVPRRSWLPLALFIFPYAASFILFFVTSRYRLVTVPFLCVLAGGALHRLASLAVGRDWRGLGWRLGVLAALVAFLSSGLAPVAQPSFALSYAEIGRRETERRRWDAAEAAFREALALQPHNLDARHDLGFVLREKGDFEGALRELRAVAEARDDATAWNNIGITLMGQGRRGEALEAFDRAIASNPEDADAWLNSSLLAAQEGDYDEALKRLERGAALRGEDPMIWYNRGIFLAELGRTVEAREALRRCLELAPGMADARSRLERLETEPSPPGGG